MYVNNINAWSISSLTIQLYVGEVFGERIKRAPGQEANREKCQTWTLRSKFIMLGVLVYYFTLQCILILYTCMYTHYMYFVVYQKVNCISAGMVWSIWVLSIRGKHISRNARNTMQLNNTMQDPKQLLSKKMHTLGGTRTHNFRVLGECFTN